jgi:hypothetical protein
MTLVAGNIVDSAGYLLLEVFFLGFLCRMYLYYSLLLKIVGTLIAFEHGFERNISAWEF